MCLLTSLINIVDGVLLVNYINVGDSRNDMVLLFLALLKGMHDCGIFCVVWLVSFKYWETVRQMTHYVRVINPNEQRESGTLGNNKANLEQNHKRYAFWKWFIIALAIGTRVVHIVFLYLMLE